MSSNAASDFSGSRVRRYCPSSHTGAEVPLYDELLAPARQRCAQMLLRSVGFEA